MTKFDWQSFLQEFSQELLADDEIRASLPPEVVQSGWLGFEGASEGEIDALEQRLGLRLPPSYRQFLQVTNGWRHTGFSISRMWSASDVGWFRDRHPDWIEACTRPYSRVPRVPDAEYFIYGDGQDSALFRPEYLKDALEISDEGISAIYLLNPKVLTESGEWEAWFFASWLPGAVRYRSFQALMQGERRGYVELAED